MELAALLEVIEQYNRANGQEFVLIEKSELQRIQGLASQGTEWEREFGEEEEPRHCQCGSGNPWTVCNANSQYCG